ncbi:hypothetical protein D3C85_877020 [compost metagenome]
MRVGKVSDSSAAVTTPQSTAPTANSSTPTIEAAKPPELARRKAGYTTTINSTQAVTTVALRPTLSEKAPASGHSAAANARAMTLTSRALARLRWPATCR